jgi:hypothetical protein
MHAKEICTGRIAMIGKTNFLGCMGRSNSGIWDGLEYMYVFNRYIDYQAPSRNDGLCYVGNLCTGWFIWNPGYKEEIKTKILDISKYAVLGNFKRKNVQCKDCKMINECDNKYRFTALSDECKKFKGVYFDLNDEDKTIW